jgi:hypothetical protein
MDATLGGVDELDDLVDLDWDLEDLARLLPDSQSACPSPGEGEQLEDAFVEWVGVWQSQGRPTRVRIVSWVCWSPK